ncbi:MAG: bifunctional hydroxymethylpyrimidine kinase/phosphomethylpyrimidine kinase [Solirubrobacteraceae bacterium]|nr:bifunctional hydroxymethylpyrimidine kinase/phosphomethylpyrimidine kinase [Solirubrobacteraceae bacterium]
MPTPSAPAPTPDADAPAITVLGPHPLLAIGIEPGPAGSDEIHLHPAGQGVWVARMAGALGAHPVLCGYLGGETGDMLRPLLEALPGECQLVPTASGSGAYVMDRRRGPNEPVAKALSSAPTRHELDDLSTISIASALRSGVLVLCNPFPGEALGSDFYERIVADVRPHGVRVLADLSSPRLEGALAGGVDIVKINDWELAEFVCGAVEELDDLAAAVGALRARGAQLVIITRGERPALVFAHDGAWELTAPSFEYGFREGCGDSMMGAMAAMLAQGADWQEAAITGAAAGAANFLRRGLGTGSRAVIDELRSAVTLRPLPLWSESRSAREAVRTAR